MIFLITKIFVYLLLAGIVGAAAGWLFRNLQAQRTEETASRAVNDAKSKVPQLESLLRGRDEQIIKLKEQLQEGKAQVNELDQAVRAGEQQLKEQEREAKRWQQSAEAAKSQSGDDFDIGADHGGDADSLIAELSQEIARLKTQLEHVPAPAAAANAGDETLLQVEMEALRVQLSKVEEHLKGATSDLLQEQNKVAELERERELQSKSLQVLHQQLELERSRRLAAAG